jgi:hypothetical protein
LDHVIERQIDLRSHPPIGQESPRGH